MNRELGACEICGANGGMCIHTNPAYEGESYEGEEEYEDFVREMEAQEEE